MYRTLLISFNVLTRKTEEKHVLNVILISLAIIVISYNVLNVILILLAIIVISYNSSYYGSTLGTSCFQLTKPGQN